jgi:hypothetical protein
MKDFDQQMKFWFENKYGDTTSSGQVNLESGAYSLPCVLEAFAQFLRQAGFTFVESVEWLGKDESDGYDAERAAADWDEDFDWDWDPAASDELFDEYWAQRYAEEEEAYEAERAYEQPTYEGDDYYDPFTRDVDWSEILPDLKLTIKVGDKVRVVRRDLGDSSYVFQREGTVDTIVDDAPGSIHAGQAVRVEFPPPAVSVYAHETSFWWVHPDALEVIG